MTFVRTTRKVELFANILHHLIAHGLGQFVLKFLEKKSKGFQVTVQVKSKAVTGVFRSISRFILKTIKDTAIVAMKKCCVSYFRLGHLLLIRSQQQHCFIDTIHRSVNSVTPCMASILLHLCTFIIHLVIYRYGGAAAGGHRLQRLRTCTARRDRNSDKVIFDWRQSTGKTETSIGCHSAHNFICLYYFDQTIKITMINKIR